MQFYLFLELWNFQNFRNVDCHFAPRPNFLGGNQNCEKRRKVRKKARKQANKSNSRERACPIRKKTEKPQKTLRTFLRKLAVARREKEITPRATLPPTIQWLELWQSAKVFFETAEKLPARTRTIYFLVSKPPSQPNPET